MNGDHWCIQCIKLELSVLTMRIRKGSCITTETMIFIDFTRIVCFLQSGIQCTKLKKVKKKRKHTIVIAAHSVFFFSSFFFNLQFESTSDCDVQLVQTHSPISWHFKKSVNFFLFFRQWLQKIIQDGQMN